jgi:hypothetical protein
MHTFNLESKAKSIIELKNRQVKLEALISVEPDEEQKAKYTHLKGELERAIQFAESQLETSKQEKDDNL